MAKTKTPTSPAPKQVAQTQQKLNVLNAEAHQETARAAQTKKVQAPEITVVTSLQTNNHSPKKCAQIIEHIFYNE